MVLQKVSPSDILYSESHITLGHLYYQERNFLKAREHYSEVLLAPTADPTTIEVAKKYLASINLDA